MVSRHLSEEGGLFAGPAFASVTQSLRSYSFKSSLCYSTASGDVLNAILGFRSILQAKLLFTIDTRENNQSTLSFFQDTKTVLFTFNTTDEVLTACHMAKTPGSCTCLMLTKYWLQYENVQTIHRLLRAIACSKIEACYASLSHLAFYPMLSRSSPTAPTQLLFSKQSLFPAQKSWIPPS